MRKLQLLVDSCGAAEYFDLTPSSLKSPCLVRYGSLRQLISSRGTRRTKTFGLSLGDRLIDELLIRRGTGIVCTQYN